MYCKNVMKGRINRLIRFFLLISLFSLCSGEVFAQSEEIIFPVRIEQAVTRASKLHGVPAKHIFAMILVENDEFDPYLRSETGDSGITQINDANLDDFRASGFHNVYDIEENVEFGTMRLKWAYEKYKNWHMAYMVYNMGEGRAKRLFNIGIYESKYSRKAMKKIENRDCWVLENPEIIGRKHNVKIPREMLAKQGTKTIQKRESLEEVKFLSLLSEGKN